MRFISLAVLLGTLAAIIEPSRCQFEFAPVEGEKVKAMELHIYQDSRLRGGDGDNVYSFRGQDAGPPHAGTAHAEEKESVRTDKIAGSEFAGILDQAKRAAALEALLPLVTMAPLLVSAGLEAAVDWSSPFAPRVTFPKLGYAADVHMLKCLSSA